MDLHSLPANSSMLGMSLIAQGGPWAQTLFIIVMAIFILAIHVHAVTRD